MPRRKKAHKDLRSIVTLLFLVFIGVVIFNFAQNYLVKEETDNNINEEQEIVANNDAWDNKTELEQNDLVEKIESNSEMKNVGGDDSAIDKESMTDSNYYKVKLAKQDVSFNYPQAWQVNELEEENKFSFSPGGAAIAAEYQGDIIVTYKENNNELPIERYYDGLNDINLFEDAVGGYEKEEIDEYTYYKFSDLIGYTPSTIGVFVLESSSFVEMNDIYNKHQEDGVFDQLAQSFQAK